MASLLYGKSVLISRPRYDERRGTWIPYGSVSWDGDKFHYHQLELSKTFATEEEALAYGFIAAREWIDKQRLIV